MKTEEDLAQVEHKLYNKLSDLSMSDKVQNIIKKLFNESVDFALEKSKNYCFIYLDNFKIMVHKYDKKCEVLVLPNDNYVLTSDDMLFFERILKG